MLTHMTHDILAIQSNDMLLKHVFSHTHEICHYYQDHLHSKTIQAIMLYMTDKNMKICKNFKSQNNSDSYLDINDTDDNNVFMSQYISDDESDVK